MDKDKLKQMLKSKMGIKLSIGAALFLVSLFMIVILYIVIIDPIFANFTIFSGIGKEDLNEGKYANVDLTEELNPKLFDTSCYDSASSNWFTSGWNELRDKLTPGINSNCELIELIKYKIIQSQKKYKNYGLELSPGLVTSTIVNVFGNQSVKSDDVDSSEPINMLTSIVESKILNEEDIDSILDAMIFRNKFWYYVCNSTSCSIYDDSTGEETSAAGKQCEKKLYYDAYFSQEKFEIFLRYGKEVADSYQAAYSHNEFVKYTCDSCYVDFGGSKSDLVNLDLTKYLVKANPKTDSDDNIAVNISQSEYDTLSSEINDINGYIGSALKETYNSQTNKNYNYKNGFIYNKFPLYKSAEYSRAELYIPKDIEVDVETTVKYAEDVNEIFDLTTITSGSKNHQNISVKFIKGDNECPSSACSCSNGGITPTPGIPVNTGETANLPVCKYLPTGENEEATTMIRLRSCIGVDTDLEKAMPGGYTLDEETGYYVANNPITLKRYIIGVAMAEIGPGAPAEAFKMQMLASQTYLFHSLEGGGIKTNSNGELLVKVCSQQFQAYYDKKVVESYDNNKYGKRDSYDDAYNSIKNQLVIDSRTSSTIFAEFGSEWSKGRTAQANSGMLYTEMLTSNEVLNYSKKPKNIKHWLYGVLKTCDLSEGANYVGTFVPDSGTTSIFQPNSTYKNKSQTVGIFGYITYYQPNPDERRVSYDPRWETSNIVSVKQDCGNGLNINWRVHKLAKTAFSKAAEGICKITTTGIDGIIISPSDISFDGAFYPRKVSDALDSTNLSMHSFGIAIDINSEYNSTVNGKTYKSIYARNLTTYENFVNAIGSESDPRNINYILWTKVFRDLGFKWGGNWGRFGDDNVYDGMHFEIDWRQTK